MIDSPKDQEEQNHDTEPPQALPTGKAKTVQAKRRGASPADSTGFPMVDVPITNKKRKRGRAGAWKRGSGTTAG